MEEVLNYFSNMCSSSSLVWVATSEDRMPHLAPVCFVKYTGHKRILVANVFLSRTAKVLQENPRIALGTAFFEKGWDGYMVKGRAEVLEEGEEFEAFRQEVEEKSGGKRSPRSAIALEVEEIYSLKPGKGKKRIA